MARSVLSDELFMKFPIFFYFIPALLGAIGTGGLHEFADIDAPLALGVAGDALTSALLGPDLSAIVMVAIGLNNIKTYFLNWSKRVLLLKLGPTR